MRTDLTHSALLFGVEPLLSQPDRARRVFVNNGDFPSQSRRPAESAAAPHQDPHLPCSIYRDLQHHAPALLTSRGTRPLSYLTFPFTFLTPSSLGRSVYLLYSFLSPLCILFVASAPSRSQFAPAAISTSHFAITACLSEKRANATPEYEDKSTHTSIPCDTHPLCTTLLRSTISNRILLSGRSISNSARDHLPIFNPRIGRWCQS